MRSSKHENELFLWKITLLNAYINIYNIEQNKIYNFLIKISQNWCIHELKH